MTKTLLKTLEMIFLRKTFSPLFMQSETTIIPESQKTPEYPFNQPQSPKRC